jgi:hypothetical protein
MPWTAAMGLARCSAIDEQLGLVATSGGEDCEIRSKCDVFATVFILCSSPEIVRAQRCGQTQEWLNGPRDESALLSPFGWLVGRNSKTIDL